MTAMFNSNSLARGTIEGLGGKDALIPGMVIGQSGVDENGNSPLKKVKVRTILTCKSHIGICAKCYGANVAFMLEKLHSLTEENRYMQSINLYLRVRN